jgi:hypothetical protein
MAWSMRYACSFANCTRSDVVVPSDVVGGACSFPSRACLHFSNASFLAAVITYGLHGLPGFVNLRCTGVPVSMVDDSVSNYICEDCSREIASQHLTERICALLDMASKEGAFIQEHSPFTMPTSEQRTSWDIYDECFVPDMTEEQFNNIPDETREVMLEHCPILQRRVQGLQGTRLALTLYVAMCTLYPLIYPRDRGHGAHRRYRDPRVCCDPIEWTPSCIQE